MINKFVVLTEGYPIPCFPASPLPYSFSPPPRTRTQCSKSTRTAIAYIGAISSHCARDRKKTPKNDDDGGLGGLLSVFSVPRTIFHCSSLSHFIIKNKEQTIISIDYIIRIYHLYCQHLTPLAFQTIEIQ